MSTIAEQQCEPVRVTDDGTWDTEHMIGVHRVLAVKGGEEESYLSLVIVIVNDPRYGQIRG